MLKLKSAKVGASRQTLQTSDFLHLLYTFYGQNYCSQYCTDVQFVTVSVSVCYFLHPNKVCLHVDTHELTRDALSAKGITENHILTHTQTHRRSLVCLQTD